MITDVALTPNNRPFCAAAFPPERLPVGYRVSEYPRCGQGLAPVHHRQAGMLLDAYTLCRHHLPCILTSFATPDSYRHPGTTQQSQPKRPRERRGVRPLYEVEGGIQRSC